MTLDDYKTWTGEAPTLTEEQFAKVLAVAKLRLAAFLCLDELPEPLPDDLAMVLANFMCAVQAHQGKDANVTSKRVRNFTIGLTSNAAGDAFSQITRQYGDILEQYSQCGGTVSVESSWRRCRGRV